MIAQVTQDKDLKAFWAVMSIDGGSVGEKTHTCTPLITVKAIDKRLSALNCF